MTTQDHAGGEPQVIAAGFALGESPRWHEGRLWFADWGAQEVIALGFGGGREVVLRETSVPCCIDWLPDGRLLVVSGQEGLLLRREIDGSLVTHADLSGLSEHPWNDIAVDGRGNAYIGNIGFDFSSGDVAPGTIALVMPGGAARQVAEGVMFPNGMVVTPDDRTLIVAESYGGCLTAFDITPDGGLSNRRVWAPLEGGYPDGICLDAEGAVWYADVPNKRCARVREGGEVLQTIELDRGCFACALGGADGRTLFVVAADWGGAEGTEGGHPTGQVLAIQVAVPGAGRSDS
jgi:sugar lactone lactonase YvrE